MRRLLLIASVLLLAGCTDADWAYVTPGSGGGKPITYPDAASANMAAFVSGRNSAPSPEQKCARTAKERSEDTGAQGFDGGVQQQVYDRTYADCLVWATHMPK